VNWDWEPGNGTHELTFESVPLPKFKLGHYLRGLILALVMAALQTGNMNQKPIEVIALSIEPGVHCLDNFNTKNI